MVKNSIIDEISTYDSDMLDRYMQMLNFQIEEQEELNRQLKREDYQENINRITEFVARNKGEIEDKLEKIKEASKRLKNLVNENRDIETKGENYKELLENEENKGLAKQLSDIRKIKDDLFIFLSARNITMPRF
tara:strand:- start:158 stop:559 length:402 start_codon:yes stop_codon:yes gene_type:complete